MPRPRKNPLPTNNTTETVMAQPEELRPAQPVKKGFSSWKPASKLSIAGKDPNYRYRVAAKNDKNLAKKLAEGWEIVNNVSESGEQNDVRADIRGGKSLTSAREGHDWILIRMPEELAKQRDEYYGNLTARRTSQLSKELKQEAAKDGAPAHGEITMKRGNNIQIIN